ncbi:MAG: IS110 family transposase [Alphaproteobacteria bacterium]
MFYGLDVHKRFIQVCEVDDDGHTRREFRLATTPEAIDGFGARLGPKDHVVLEATFHTWAIWSRLVPRAGTVVVANPLQVKAIAHARIKTDKIDARILAQLLRAGLIPEVEMPDAKTWELRQLVAHRRFLGKRLVAAKNAIRGVVNKRLLVCQYVELFGPSGRRWLAEQAFTDTEWFIVGSVLDLHDAIERRLVAVDARLRVEASMELDAKLLMTVPGVNITVAIGLLSAIGDIRRFPAPQKLAAYFGLAPSTYQSGDTCHHGRITKQGRSHARWLAIEAAQSVAMSSAPLSATYHRVKRKKGHNVAVTALARKLVVLVWHLLRHREPYRYAPVARTRHKLRRVSPHVPPARIGQVPTTLEAIYAEAGLPIPTPPTPGEKRVTAVNRRAITIALKDRRPAAGVSRPAERVTPMFSSACARDLTDT